METSASSRYQLNLTVAATQFATPAENDLLCQPPHDYLSLNVLFWAETHWQ